jgi:hypothetical protein
VSARAAWIVTTVALALVTAGALATSASARVLQRIGTTGDSRLRYPDDAGVAASGEIYVLDAGNRASSQVLMKVYAPGGALVRSFAVGRLGEGGGVPFMALDAAGNSYVGASGLNDLAAYSATGQRLAGWRIGDGEQDYPVSLAADRGGRVLVAEANGRIETFDGLGHRLASWQREAGSLAVGSSGTIYLADDRGIAPLDSAGNAGARIVAAGRGPAGYSAGRLVAGPAGSLYVVHQQRVQKFGADGAFLGAVGLDRRAQTASVAVAGDGTIYAPQWLFGGVDGALLKLAPITAVDVTPPAITVVSIASAPIARGRATPRRPVLARLTYALSESASFRVSLKRRASNGRYLRSGTLDVAFTARGRHTLTLGWRALGYQHPRSGDYLLVLVARDDAGNESRPTRARLHVR